MSRSVKITNGDSGGASPPAYYKAPPDAVINIDSEDSLSKWESVLHLSRAELLSAIKDFGPVVRDIRRGLRARNQDEAA